MAEPDYIPIEPDGLPARRYERPRERKFLYWGLGFVCGAASMALTVVAYDRLAGRPPGGTAATATATTSGTSRPAPAAPAGPEDPDFARARKSVEAALTEPGAQFDTLTVANSARGKLVCGYVGEKNGGQARRHPFLYHPGADLSFVLINRKEAFVAATALGAPVINACFPNYQVPRTAAEASRE
jgi:hypothetical protein